MDSPNTYTGSTPATHWQYLALSDEQLEKVDLVRMNLTVARAIPGLENLDVERYVRIVDEWTARFRAELRGMERNFKRSPWKWKNNVHFFRVGMAQGFLGHVIGIRYNKEQLEDAKAGNGIYYTNPGDLFLHGVIDTKEGTCGNMATLHVAVCRRMGWPVALACAGSHYLSRYDDGELIHNIEATSTHPGSFNSEDDQFYLDKFNLPKRAIESGSDLRKLTAREMVAIFIGQRARHLRDCATVYRDKSMMRMAELDYSLARVLFPNHRKIYVATMNPVLERGYEIFDPGERGHPTSIFDTLGPLILPNIPRPTNGKRVQICKVPQSGPRHTVLSSRKVDVHVVNLTRRPDPDHKGKEILQ